MIATNNIAYCCFNFAISATTTAATTKNDDNDKGRKCRRQTNAYTTSQGTVRRCSRCERGLNATMLRVQVRVNWATYVGELRVFGRFGFGVVWRRTGSRRGRWTGGGAISGH